MSKMNFRNIPYLFFLACTLLMISCSQPQPFVFKGLKSIKIEKASLGKNVFKAEFTYYRPASAAFWQQIGNLFACAEPKAGVGRLRDVNLN